VEQALDDDILTETEEADLFGWAGTRELPNATGPSGFAISWIAC
jgi:hypothetical protein